MTINHTKDLLYNTIISIYDTPQNYINFLKTSANNFKYGYMDRVLIHAQNPKARACADMITWNKLNRWINKGAKSISLLSNNNGKFNLKFIFDISDTNDASEPYIWNTDNHSELIIKLLQNEISQPYYNNISNPYHLMKTLVSNKIKEIEPLPQNSDLKEFIIDSVTYICLERCGHNADTYFLPEKFQLKEMQDLDTSCKTGILISQLSSSILKSLSKNIKKELHYEQLTNSNSSNNNSISSISSGTERSRIHQIDHTKSVGNSHRSDESVDNGTLSNTHTTTNKKSKYNRGSQGEESIRMGSGNREHSDNSKRNNNKRNISINEKAPHGSQELSSNNTQVTFEEITKIQDYKIKDLHPDYGTASKRYQNNINAIRTLKKVELEQRAATPEEQEILSKYVGWGGLSDCFDKRHSKYNELKALLTDEEYSAARASTRSAFYTPPYIIKEIYTALENCNVKGKINLLEPSCGIGNFLGLVPNSINPNITGIEIDFISARITKLLYPSATIQETGYENSTLKDNSFDIAISNIPFDDIRINDPKYNKNNFLIHDYFFAKTLDKVRPNGIIAFITSKGTMDKANPTIRKYIAQRAKLIGAIRLPNNAFTKNANTRVTSDIIFLQKREQPINEPQDNWIHINNDNNNIPINEYFIENPKMILGDMQQIKNQYGRLDYLCVPNDKPLEELLHNAIQNIKGNLPEYSPKLIEESSEDDVIQAEPNTRNYSFTTIKGKIYYCVNGKLTLVQTSGKDEQRLFDFIELRDTLRSLIELQANDYPDENIIKLQKSLNNLYELFRSKYGYINSRPNENLFGEDASFPLLSSLEILDEEGKFKRKSDIFTKRTIRPYKKITSVDNSIDALAVSISEKAGVDINFMAALCNKTPDVVANELKNVIYKLPEEPNKYVTADEYLSGNIRKKLAIAELAAQTSPEFDVNVTALKNALPKDLSAEEISVHLGATWISPEIYNQFIFELLSTPRYNQSKIKIHYSDITSEWNVEGKSIDLLNVKANNTYGTSRINAYKIIENALNLRDTKIYDYIYDESGKSKPVINKTETAIAQAKQELIKEKFSEWIWEDPIRRNKLTKLYNERFNSVRCREYNGEHIKFYGMNPEISLRPHQRNAVARILYGGNSLLAHVVGAGKTFTMIAAAQESKRLGLCNKSMFVVPNHLLKQWQHDYLTLYPSANILVATKKDFEKNNRKKFCSRIATGDYDAVIIGHSQFEKIPLSLEEQRKSLENQLEDIINSINSLKENDNKSFSVKQLEKTRKTLQVKLEKLNDQSRKDDVVTFEELGVDRLFVDEAHYYKNLYIYTKMRNIGGISQTEAQKSSDMYMKCRYLDKITNNKGTIFATGTPVSNSMVELYTMQRYLQYDELVKHNLQHFDSWASTFGETVTAIELAPEGTGYRAKTRFAKFHNIPELMTMFKNVADIQTSDMLNLPVPQVKYETVLINPSELQKQLISELAERAKVVRDKKVDSSIDNMLKITNDGRKVALDQRLINDTFPNDLNSKVSVCADKVYEIWENTKNSKSTQTVFCDFSTPAQGFNVYDELRNKLIAKGIPKNEIAFIHDAKNDNQKKKLFDKVNKGEIRIIMGSTAKMGAGTNIQERLIASHDLDCPWRPSDLEQRAGRIIRQGNKNPNVSIYRYVTKDTFDAYLFQMIENKQRMVSQIMTSKTPVRSAEDIDEAVLSYAEIKSLATGNPLIKEKMDLDIKVSKLKLLRQNHLNQRYQLQDKLLNYYPQIHSLLQAKKEAVETDIKNLEPLINQPFEIVIDNNIYRKRIDAGNKLAEKLSSTDGNSFGHYKGLSLSIENNLFNKTHTLIMKGNNTYKVELGDDSLGNIMRITNCIDNIGNILNETEQKLSDIINQQKTAEKEVDKPFPQEAEYQQAIARLAELDSLLNMDNQSKEIAKETESVLADENPISNYCNSYATFNLNNERIFENELC